MWFRSQEHQENVSFRLDCFLMQKSIVIFYSLEGNTQFIAEHIAKKTWADILQLQPQKDIKSTWFMKYMRWGKQVIMKATPKLQPRNIDIDAYDTIILWTPVRAFTYAPALRTFFSQQQFTNKKIFLFCCHEWSKGRTLENMEENVQGNTLVAKIDFFAPLKKDKEEQVKKLDQRLDKYF